MPDYQWMTYSDLAERFGISRDAARMLAKRRGWPKKSGNHPGAPVRLGVPEGERVPEHVPEQFPERFARENGANGADGAPERPIADRSSVHPAGVPLIPLSMAMDLMAADRSRSDRHLAERDALHLDSVRRLVAQVEAERSLWLERIDAAEIRAERLEQRLDQVLDQLLAARPPRRDSWWRRWFGVARRTEPEAGAE